jgi:glutamate-ammonia-ligase adenylyltransferase
MEIDRLKTYLDDPATAVDWLRSLGAEKISRGHANLVEIAGSGVTLDLLAVLADQLADFLPGSSDPDMALNNLTRFVTASRNPLGLATLFERDRDALRILLQIFSASQHLSDLLITDPESYDLLRITQGQPIARETLVEEIWSELEPLADDRAAMAALRRFKQRETLRIAYGDLIREQRLEMVTKQISFLADAITDAALRFSIRANIEKRGAPTAADGRPARLVALGMGKLGGLELNYSSDIDLIFVYDVEGKTDGGRPQSNGEFFAAVIRDAVKLLTENTPTGTAYRVDLRLRPNGSQSMLAMNLDNTLQYYDLTGRTWERQAFVKARPVAGDLEFGKSFLRRLEPWIYRRYLQRADITGIKALKRRIEHRTRSAGEESSNVKTGHGGIRDIEFVIQFLQLLNGGDLPEVRTGNTLEAIAHLGEAGCLTDQERSLLSENYRFLRKLEHQLQIMFDLQTHQMPRDESELRKLAMRLGYNNDGPQAANQAFAADYQKITELNRKVLDHLLHDAFSDEGPADPEVDLVLAPEPSPQEIEDVLGRYGFKDVQQAYRNLMDLSQEKIPFLSTRRCRHFLAAIAPRLLKAIAVRTDPDSTLTNLCKVSDSLGGKGVLWELFSFNPPTLALYVELCATSLYLSSILISNPGMIDELMDSLLLDKLPELRHLEASLAELCRAAEDTEPILHSFKNAQQLRVGVRDILGKEDVQATTGSLSNIAESCLRQITRQEYGKLARRLGEPVIAEGPRAGHVSELIIVAMGKFGGRELNYHSDLDIIFLFEAKGGTQHRRPTHRTPEITSNQHFFGELGQRIINSASRLGPYGRLYEVDARLRPTGRNGPLATSLAEFARYFATGEGQLWERMALTRARVVLGNELAAAAANEAIAKAAFGHPWKKENADELLGMRRKLEDSAAAGNLKRGRGGIVDVEFIAQMLQLRFGHEIPTIREPNTLAALIALHDERILGDEDYAFLDESYRLLRRIEGRLRLMHSTARNDLPADPNELAKLAQSLGYPESSALLTDCKTYTNRNRELFDRFFREAAAVG